MRTLLLVSNMRKLIFRSDLFLSQHAEKNDTNLKYQTFDVLPRLHGMTAIKIENFHLSFLLRPFEKWDRTWYLGVC